MITRFTNLADGTIDDLNNIESTSIGHFKLLQNNLEKSQKGGMYIDTNQNWLQLCQGNISFNTFDLYKNNVVHPLNALISENIYKMNVVIVKIKGIDNGDIAYFYINSPLVDNNGIVNFLIVKSDFIGYRGQPKIGAIYNMSYIYKNPANQKNIKKLPLLSEPLLRVPPNGEIFNTIKPKNVVLSTENDIELVFVPKDLLNTHFCPVIKHDRTIIMFITFLTILYFVSEYKFL
jgi:hypothetical protein